MPIFFCNKENGVADFIVDFTTDSIIDVECSRKYFYHILTDKLNHYET